MLMAALSSHDDTDDLLERTRWGDDRARNLLLKRHRARLRTMVAVRRDHRLKPRVYP
jgi:hypothetical protein